MIRNNLSNQPTKIPNIEIKPFPNWNQTMEIEFKKNFSMTDLYIVVRSYTDSLITMPIQIMVQVEDLNEKGRYFFTESVSIFRLKEMSLSEFNNWYLNRYEIDQKYIENLNFKHKIIFKYVSVNKEELYPIYPWKQWVLDEMLIKNVSNDELKEKIEKLEAEIEELKKKK